MHGLQTSSVGERKGMVFLSTSPHQSTGGISDTIEVYGSFLHIQMFATFFLGEDWSRTVTPRCEFTIEV